MKRVKKIFSFLLIAVLSMALVTGCGNATNGGDSSSEDNSKKLVFSAGDSKVYLDEMMYYILSIEAEYEYVDQMYMSMNGTGFWDMDYEEGKTMRDGVKDYTMELAQMSEIIYQEAVKAGTTLTEEEKTEISENVKSIMENITEEQFKITGLNEELITKIVEKMFIGGKHQEQMIKDFNITEDEIKSGLNFDEYKQYNTQALYISKTTVDDEGNSVDLSEKQLKAAKKSMEEALEKVKAGDAFDKIAESNDDMNVEDNNFTATDEVLSEEYKTEAKKLENDKYSDLVETDDGFYIIKMVDNNSTESYDQAIADATTQKEQEMFDAEYKKIRETYEVTVNDEVWGTIVMGKTTIVETPAEDETTDGEVPADDAAATDNGEAPADDTTATDNGDGAETPAE